MTAKRIVVALLFLALLCSVTGCAGNQTLQYLDYSTGIDENGQYNADMYMLNGDDTIGADPGVLYVSVEDDPVNGGYFYMYATGFSYQDTILASEEYANLNRIGFQCWRSRDLSNWELFGALNGYSLAIENEDWPENRLWAPEVIRNPEDGKYYMYFTATYPEGWEGQGLSASSDADYRMAPCVAVSDAPAGPFKILYNVDPESGNRVPIINIQTGCDLEYSWPIIDMNPFLDDDGTLYMYFVMHGSDHYEGLYGLWGMKMNSMTEPDYSTITCLLKGGYKNLTHTPGAVTTPAEVGEEYYDDESGINEGPFMVKHDGKYYLTYSANGYAHPDYQLHQAVSDSPLSGFVKVDYGQGNPVLNGNQFDYMNGTGHASFVWCENELWVIYHRHDKTYNWINRSICADRVSFVENADGIKVMTANGPTLSLQWQSEAMSGYKNLAQTANISANTKVDTAYLNDEILPFYEVAQDLKASIEKDTTFTFQWDEAVDVSSVMIFNARDIATAFSQIADIRIKTEVDGKVKWMVIKDLKFPDRYMDSTMGLYMLCSPAVAEFETLTTTEIRITVKVQDSVEETAESIDISEVVILGGKNDE